MFAFIQAHLKSANLIDRAIALVEQLETLPQDKKIIFVSADLLSPPMTGLKAEQKKSASSFLFSLEEEEALDILKNALPSDTTLIFNEEERIFSIRNGRLEELVFKRMNVFEVQGHIFSYSYNSFPTQEQELLPTEFHIHYNKKPFTVTFQEEQEEFFKYFAKQAKKDVVSLNSVYAFEGNLFHGQSLYVNKEGELTQRAKAFEPAILLDNLFYLSPEYKEIYPLIFDALVFGIRVHVKASGLRKIVLGLSGGIDSALVAPLAVEAIGKENVIGLIMPSMHSSEGSVADAKKLAENLGITAHIVPIKDSVESFDIFKEIAKEHNANEQNTELMLQNIQSRLRAVSLMALANALPAYLLATGNKSEASMGYCTLYGDSCGGLFPLGDLYKFHVYALAKWYNNYKEFEIIPENSITKAPSAELAPNQKDSDSLPEYTLLDSYLYELFEGKKDPFEIEHVFTEEERFNVLSKIKNAEYKRSQLAPIIRLFNVSVGKDWK